MLRQIRTFCRSASSKQESKFNVFDRKVKLLQRTRAANDEESLQVEYLRDEIARRTVHRLSFIKREAMNLLDFGCGSGNFVKTLLTPTEDELMKDNINNVRPKLNHVYMVDSCLPLLERNSFDDSFVTKINADEEEYNHEILQRKDFFDCAISNLSLHWINNLPGTFRNINNSLKEDGLFMGSMFATDTLFELRTSLQLAEMERRGGISPRISPFVDSSDLGNLLQKANFNLVTVDVEEIIVNFPDVWCLMRDLQLMGENNAIANPPGPITKDMLIALDPIYRSLHGDEKTGALPATFRIVFMIGWKKSDKQPKPLERGSGQVSLKDVL
ncbi:hypothetical protein LJB42_002969 [Komagataella kurtzmanii]|nr:hypothetical protein LJB42_002969 [Komagataella kurtzmanii]